MTRSSKQVRKRVGILGGSFDPPHIGHLILADYIREHSRLDRVIFLPAFQSPQKIGNNCASPRHRLAMTRIAIRGNAQFVLSDLEVRKGGISYTVETLSHLRREHPLWELSLILGSDAFLDFPSWHQPAEIVQMAGLIVYPRTGFEISTGGEYDRHAEFLEAPRMEISSTMIRRRVTEGKSIRYLVPPLVEKYIAEKRLYTRRMG